MSTSTIKDANGVELAGPDTPGLQLAEAREGADVTIHGGLCARPSPAHGLIGASAGDVAVSQAGILPGRIRITDAMVLRAQQAGSDHGQLLDERFLRAILEAALAG